MLSPQSKTNTPSSLPPRRSGRVAWTVLVGLIVGVVLVTIHHQSILDWWNLYNYKAPAAISKIADDTAMSSYGRKVFYMNHPQLVAKAQFADVCPVGEEQTIVLGCYHSRQDGIYVLDVNDPRLDGVEQVTAAHEMLHGAYDRLTSSERSRVNSLLQDYYENDLKDERLKKTIELYKQTEPDDVPNEMHSIFATEVQNLPIDLEDYYSQYFTNRNRVVGLAERYQSEFTSREQTIAQLDAQITDLKQQIDAREADLDALQRALQKEDLRMSQLKIRGEIADYNAAVAPYNASVVQYNQQVEQAKALVAQHNQLVTERNQVALEADKLHDEIDSKVQPINN